jgi:hypothetical protein
LAAIEPSPADAAAVQFFTTSGTIVDADPDQTGRITNGTGQTSCAVPTTATLNTATGARNFDAYTLANNLATTACITVSFDQSCAPADSLQYSAYLDSFNPASPLANHLGDVGAGNSGTQTNHSFSFNVPPGHSFVVKANATDVGGTCAGGYTLRVSSDPQQPPGPPETVIQSGPSGDQTSTDASFSFSSNQTPVTFQCSLDSATFTPCSSPKGLTGLALGTHVFQVRALHATNGLDSTPAVRAFNVVAPAEPPVVPPETVIQSGPSGDQTSTEASISFSSDQAPVTFQCSLDSAPFDDCSSPRQLTGLALGTHVFQVRAIHATNGTDPTPAVRAFNVVAPVTVPVPTPTPTGDDNAFTIGKLEHTKLSLTVPGAGVIDVSDANASKNKLLLKHSSATASGAGPLEVTLKLTKTAKKKLKEKGKVKVKAKIAFTPTGGTANTQEKVLKVRT